MRIFIYQVSIGRALSIVCSKWLLLALHVKLRGSSGRSGGRAEASLFPAWSAPTVPVPAHCIRMRCFDIANCEAKDRLRRASRQIKIRLSRKIKAELAERGGFEPPVRLLTVQRFSKPPPSATRPSLRKRLDAGSEFKALAGQPSSFRLKQKALDQVTGRRRRRSTNPFCAKLLQ